MLSEKLEDEVERRTLERDRIWNVSEDLLAVSNFEGYFLSINPAWTRLLGWSEDEIKSMHVSELRHPDDAPAAIAGRAQLAHGVPTVRMENRFRHKDGSWRWLQWTMTESNGLALRRRPARHRREGSRRRARARAAADRASAEDGRHRPVDRRHRPRLQQPVDDRQRPCAEPEETFEGRQGHSRRCRPSKWRRRAART